MTDKVATAGRGEFVGTRITNGGITLWVEGRDCGEPSVSGTLLHREAAEILRDRLTAQLEQLASRDPRTAR